MSEHYTTPPGTYENLVPYPSSYSDAQVNELKRRGIRFVEYDGTTMAIGPGMTIEFYKEISQRKKERMSAIIAILGSPGKGKTWSGLELCRIFDKKFDVAKQVCFSREHFMKIISGEIKINPGQCVLMDEAHMAAGARHWFKDLQKDMVDQVATIRSMGIILIFVILHLSMIDSIIRQFVLTYQLHMEKRGVVTQYRVTMPRFGKESFHPRVGRIGLAIPDVKGCASPDCLWCPDRKKKEKGDGIVIADRFLPVNQPCINMRAIYERNKQDYLALTRKEAVRKSDQMKLTDDPMAKENMLFEIMFTNKERLKYTRTGIIDPSSIREILAEEDIPIGRHAATDIAKRFQWRYPDLKPPGEE